MAEKTLHIAENQSVVKVRSNHYLLFTYSLFIYTTKRTTGTSLIINYKKLSMLKNYMFMQSKTPADDYQCETFENG